MIKINPPKLLMSPGQVSLGLIGLALVALVASSFYAFLSLLSFIRITPELTDAAYYVFQTQFAHLFPVQIHTYGKVWQSFFGENGIVFNRVLHILIVVCAPCFFAFRLAPNTDKLRFPMIITTGLIGCLFLTYFGIGILDPSYNSLVGSVSCVVMGVAIRSFKKLSGKHDIIFRSFLLGGLVPVLTLTKITAAPLIGLLAIIYFLISLNQDPFRIGKTLGLVVVSGAAGLCLCLWVIYAQGFGGVFQIVSQLLNSAELFQLLGSHDTSFFDLHNKSDVFFELLFKRFAHIDHAALAVSLAFVVPAVIVFYWDPKDRFKCAGLLLLLALIFMSGYQGVQIINNSTPQLVSEAFARILLFGVILLALNDLNTHRQLSRLKYLPLLFLPYFLMVGTNNDYAFFLPAYAGFFLISALPYFDLAWFGFEREDHTVSILIGQALCAVLFLAASILLYVQIENFRNTPYRFHGSLNNELIETEFGINSEKMLTSEKLYSVYASISDLRQTTALSDTSIGMIDWTGRLPGVALHLGLKPLKVAWLVGSYPGENEFADEILVTASPDEIASSWILISEDMTRSVSLLIEILDLNGLNFPDDYEVVATFENPNLGDQSLVYRPK
ncbi:MAG: hypothetical protein ACON4J_07315 [Parvibaculales bacterium]